MHIMDKVHLKTLLATRHRLILSLIFAIGVWAMWYWWYPYILMQHEQSSLFLWDWAFVKERLDMPGGLPSLAAAFVSQFFYHRFLGATVMALLALMTQGLLWWVLRHFSRATWLFCLTFIPAAVVAGLPFRISSGTDEEMRYDYLLRQGKWAQIIACAQQEPPASPACQNALLLARFQMGQLDEQAQLLGLNTSKQTLTGRTAAFIMSEVYMHMALVTMSQRCAFEAMESIEDFNKSGRALQRLAVTNLVCGQSEVARKYLMLLSRTTFYHPWAERMMPLALHPERVTTHPTLGRLQQLFRESKDVFFH